MNNSQGLVKTLDFRLDIQSGNEGLLYDATLEARRVYNETSASPRTAWTGTRFPHASKTTPTS